MLTLNGQKMSKSTDNNILPAEIFSKGSPLLSKTFSESCVKFFMLQAHYRSVLDLSNDALLAAEKGYNKLMDSIEILENFENFGDKTNFDVKEWVNKCYKAMNDDFNTPILIANIFEAVKFINKTNHENTSISKDDWEVLLSSLKSFVFDVMGLEKQNLAYNENSKINDVLDVVLELRNDARKSKNYELSDRIRDLLKNKGIKINDSDDKSSFTIE